MFVDTRSSLALVPLAVLLAHSGAATASAADSAWAAPVAGDFFDPSRWTNGLPGPADGAIFGIGDSTVPYVVTGSASTTIGGLVILTHSPQFAFSAGRGGIPTLSVSGDFTVRPAFAFTSASLVNTNLSVGGLTTVGGNGAVTSSASLAVTGDSSLTCGTLALGWVGGVGTITLTDGAEANALPGAVWTVGDATGSGLFDLGSGCDLNAGSAQLRLGRHNGDGELRIAANSTVWLNGGTIELGGDIAGGLGGLGFGKVSLAGAIRGQGALAVAPSGGGAVLDCGPQCVVEVPVTLGPNGQGTILCAGLCQFDSLKLLNGGMTASGVGTDVQLASLVCGGTASLNVCCGASVTVPTLTMPTGAHPKLQAAFGGTLVVTDSASFGQLGSFVPASAATIEAKGIGSVAQLPALAVGGGGPLFLKASDGGSMSFTSLTSPATAHASLSSTNGSSIVSSGAIKVLGSAPSGGFSATVGPESTITCPTFETGPTSSIQWTLPLSAPGIVAENATLRGSLSVTTTAGWQPSGPGEVRLVACPNLVTESTSFTLPDLLGYPPLVVLDSRGLAINVIDHIDSLNAPAAVAFPAGEAIEIPISITLDGVTTDVTPSVTWTFDPPIVVATSPTRLVGLAAGATTGVVRYGASSAEIQITVTTAEFSLSLVSGTPLAFGNGDSGATLPELFGTVSGLRPRGMSADGFVVAFSSHATNLATVTQAGWNVFTKDLGTVAFTLVSNGPDGGDGSADAGASMSRDARYLVFQGFLGSSAQRILLSDQTAGTVVAVDVGYDGSTPNGSAAEPRVSDDGRFVLFQSAATNLVPDDTNGKTDVFLRDRELGTTTRVSVAAEGGQLGVSSAVADLSTDGRYSLFLRKTAGWTLAYRYDRDTGEVLIASPGYFIPLPQVNVLSAQLSDDGRQVIFIATGLSQMSDMDAPPSAQIYRHDMVTGATIAVSLNTQGDWLSAPITSFAASGLGRFVVFTSKANNVEPPGTGSFTRLFRRDLFTGVTTLASTWFDGAFNADVEPPVSMSADGLHVAFATSATNVVPGDTGGFMDVFAMTFAAPVLGDLDGDSSVGPTDLGLLLGAWGSDQYDLDGDGVVGASDLGVLLGAWN